MIKEARQNGYDICSVADELRYHITGLCEDTAEENESASRLRLLLRSGVAPSWKALAERYMKKGSDFRA